MSKVAFLERSIPVPELVESEGIIVEQVIRPTGLLDPVIEVRPSLCLLYSSHFDGLVSVTTASLAASSGYIERETPRLIDVYKRQPEECGCGMSFGKTHLCHRGVRQW